jgi:hypothetical protein
MKLQLLMHPHCRNDEAIAAAKNISQSLGISPTAEGGATVSAEVDLDTFQSLFGKPPTEPSGPESVSDESLPVPEPLREYVQSISVAPRHIYMSGPKRRPA